MSLGRGQHKIEKGGTSVRRNNYKERPSRRDIRRVPQDRSGRPHTMSREEEEPVYGFDNTLFITLLFLLAFGLVMLFSVSYNTAYNKFDDGMYFVKSQLEFMLIGFAAMLIIVHIKSSVYGGWRAWLLYAIALVLMLMVKFTPLGVELNGARRWLKLPVLGTFQPSEFMKVGIIMVTPTLLYRMKIVELDKDTWMWVSIPCAIATIVTFWATDNLSTAIIIAGIGMGMLSLLAADFQKLVVLGLKLLAVAIGIIVVFGEFLYNNMEGFRIGRLFMWNKLDEYATDGGYQVLQGLYAIGSGGLFGKGLGNGTQKLSSIPEVQNDMIFSAISEELGIIGLIILLGLYGLLLYRLYLIACNAPTLHASLIVAGIFLHIALQVVVNLCVVTNLLPNTGVTLPFISYGGTALLVLMCEVSIALGISRQS